MADRPPSYPHTKVKVKSQQSDLDELFTGYDLDDSSDSASAAPPASRPSSSFPQYNVQAHQLEILPEMNLDQGLPESSGGLGANFQDYLQLQSFYGASIDATPTGVLNPECDSSYLPTSFSSEPPSVQDSSSPQSVIGTNRLVGTAAPFQYDDYLHESNFLAMDSTPSPPSDDVPTCEQGSLRAAKSGERLGEILHTKAESSEVTQLEHYGKSAFGNEKNKNKSCDEKRQNLQNRPRKIAFKTKSKLDVLDDGYKWRKYGQKAVKNSPHPRSYYRCTEIDCNVKKRVQRFAEDPEYVITTYESIHNHPLPVPIQYVEYPLSFLQCHMIHQSRMPPQQPMHPDRLESEDEAR